MVIFASYHQSPIRGFSCMLALKLHPGSSLHFWKIVTHMFYPVCRSLHLQWLPALSCQHCFPFLTETFCVCDQPLCLQSMMNVGLPEGLQWGLFSDRYSDRYSGAGLKALRQGCIWSAKGRWHCGFSSKTNRSSTDSTCFITTVKHVGAFFVEIKTWNHMTLYE